MRACFQTSIVSFNRQFIRTMALGGTLPKPNSVTLTEQLFNGLIKKLTDFEKNWVIIGCGRAILIKNRIFPVILIFDIVMYWWHPEPRNPNRMKGEWSNSNIYERTNRLCQRFPFNPLISPFIKMQVLGKKVSKFFGQTWKNLDVWAIPT